MKSLHMHVQSAAVARTLMAALALVGGAGSAAARPRGYDVAPAGAWVAPQPFDPPSAATAGAGGDNGVEVLLWDLQEQVVGRADRRYARVVETIRSPAGLEELSHLRITFHAAFERLTIHEIRVLRNGRWRNATATSAINVIGSEPQLNGDILTGASSAVIVMNDLRVGDVIDWSYTIDGANPVLRGHLSTSWDLGYGFSIRRLHGRLIVGDGRRVRFKSHGLELKPTEQVRGATREYEWERRDVTGLRQDDSLPEWFAPLPWLQASDFESWNDVARWASALFPAAGVHDAAVAELVARWRRLPDARQRAEAALSFVRQDVRYFGMELGANSHEPHPPGVVLAQRYGDCKDKAYLLVTMLRALDIAAAPAMTETAMRRRLDSVLPSIMFNHVVVRLVVDGKTWWVDPTASDERGHLDELPALSFERALVVDPETAALSQIVEPPLARPDEVVEEHYYQEPDGSLRLDVETRVHGAAAAYKRRMLARQSLEQLSEAWREHYASAHPGLEVVAPPAVKDAGDTITVSEHYRMTAEALDGPRDRTADAITGVLQRPKISRRTMPLAQPFPLFIEQHVRVDVPRARLRTDAVSLQNDAFELHRTAQHDGRGFDLRFTFKTLTDSVEARDTERYLAAVDRMDRELQFGLQYATTTDGGDDAAMFIAGLIMGALVLLVVGWLVGPRLRNALRRRRLRRRVEHREGEVAATAIVVADEAALERELDRRRCSCRPGPNDERSDDSAQYLGRTVTVVQLVCASCGMRRRLYFARRDLAA